jgi:hypothetical protein
MDTKVNRESPTRRQRALRLIAVAAALPVVWAGISFPVGLKRTSADHTWCGGSGKAASGCIERRRAERWGPFKAWGWNNHSSGD